MSQRPNILWIMSDQHHAGCMGCAGNPDVKTPNLDKLASGGIRFERAYCNNPICAPSRVCFLTGQYVGTHGISGNDVFWLGDTGAPNGARHFRSHGYETALIGKAHLPRLWVERGFEHIRLCDLTDCDGRDPRDIHYFAHLAERGIADLYDHGQLPPGHPGHGNRAFVSDIPLEDSVEVWTGNEALQFLRHRDRSRPFFLQLSFQRPHDPYAPSPEDADWYEAEKLTLPDNASDFLQKRFEGKPRFQKDYTESSRTYPYKPASEADLKHQLAAYYTLITRIDAEIGRVLAELQRTGEDANTVIVYHADHGDFAAEHGLMLKNFGIYESVHRIPFLLRLPGGPVGEVRNDLVESVDLLPTLCHVAGVPVPVRMDGRVIAGGEPPPAIQGVRCEWDYPIAPKEVLAWRTATHRLVLYPSTPEDGELYDCVNDPGELRNLFHESSARTIREQLRGQLLAVTRNAIRCHGLQEDLIVQGRTPGPARLVHQLCKPWSEVKTLLSEKPAID